MLAYNSRVRCKVVEGQLEKTETGERKGMPKIEVNILDWSAHHNVIIFLSSPGPTRVWLR